jgi:hypothetical protein
MARLVTCGFELRSIIEFAFNTANIAPSWPTGRTNIGLATGVCFSQSTFNNVSYSRIDFTSGSLELFLSFACSQSAVISGEKFSLRDSAGNNILRLSCASLGSAFTYQVGTSTSLGTGVVGISSSFVLVEIHFLLDATVGVCEVRIDGVSDLSFSGNTNPQSRTNISQVVFGCVTAGNGNQWSMDDLVINDSTGSIDNVAPGDRRILLLTPSGNGASSQFVGSDGNSTDNYLLVDEVPHNSDSDYVQSATVNDVDSYAMSDIATLATGDAIGGIQPVAVAKRANASVNGSLRCNVKSSSAVDHGADVSLGTTYQIVRGNYVPLDPNTGVAWTASGVNAMESQIEVRT